MSAAAPWRRAAAALALALAGCEADAPPAGAPAAGSAAVAAHEHGHAHDHGHGDDHGQGARPDAAGARIAASVITIAHADVRAYASRRPKPARSEAEALSLARTLVAEARQDPARFAALARERSEDPLAPAGGDMGTWTLGERPDVDGPVAALAVGAVSDPIAGEHGFRVFRRDPPLPDARLAARQLVVAWAGATRAPASVTRTRGEALARAESLSARASADPAAFEALVRAESDGWDRARGGALGAWTANGGRYPAALDRAVSGLAEGAISGPVETELGYHVLQRLAAAPPPEVLAGAHILVAFAGAEKARAGVRRSREEARVEAERIAEEARRDPAGFGRLARELSDDATGARGGDLGSFRRGSLPGAIEDALAALGAGEVGGPVLTPYGYHVVLRREAPSGRDYVPR